MFLAGKMFSVVGVCSECGITPQPVVLIGWQNKDFLNPSEKIFNIMQGSCISDINYTTEIYYSLSQNWVDCLDRELFSPC